MNRKLIQTLCHNDLTVKVYRVAEFDEYHVVDPSKSVYYTPDKDDAIATARYLVGLPKEGPAKVTLNPVVPATRPAPALVYTATGEPVKEGDRITLDGGCVEVIWFGPPKSPASEGKVTVKALGAKWGSEYYVSVIGAKWINRRDRIEYV